MNNINDQENLVKAFKEEVAKKLPIWVKTSSEEQADVLDELESHIWDKAEELAQGGNINSIHVREAIALMGPPREIAKEYRKRGTPKFYITEELFDWYYKSLIILGAVIFFGNLVSMGIAFVGDKPAGQIVGEFFADIAIGLLVGFVGISLMFIQLSMHGFLPHDLKKIVDKKGTFGYTYTIYTKKPKQEKPRVDLAKEERKAERRAKRKGILDSQSSYVFGGIIGITMGFFMLLYPIGTIGDFIGNYPEFLQWVRLAGGLVLAQGAIRFGQALAGKNQRWHQVMMVLYIASNCLWIPLLLQLQYDHTVIVNMFIDIFYWHPADKILLYVQIGSWFTVAANILGAFNELSKIIQLELKGFSQKG